MKLFSQTINQTQVKRSSSRLLLLSLLFICCFAATAYYSFKVNSQLQFDASVINQAGIIRGSIQRYSKMSLAGCTPACVQIKQLIDDTLSQFIDVQYHADDLRSYSVFRQHNIRLKSLWDQLYQLTERYQQQPSEQHQQALLSLSEEVWAYANETVFVAQKRSEDQHQLLDVFYPASVLFFVVSIGLMILVFKCVRYELEYEVGKDPLTGLNNRRVFDRELSHLVDCSKRYKSALSLLYIDLDHFKQINDHYGHICGDKVLKDVAEFVGQNIRKVDIFCRIGGEEFAIIVPDTDLSHCLQLATKLREDIQQQEFTQGISLTVSIGISSYHPSMDLASFVSSADQALYKAKQNGRNRTEIYSTSSASASA